MVQKKTAAAKSARKTIKLPPKAPAKVSAKVPAKVPAAAPLLVAVEARSASAPNAASSGKDLRDLGDVAAENLEACVECGTIAAKGVEELGTKVMSFTQASIEADLAAAKDILAAKTLHEAIDLQTSFAQARLERMTNETAKLGELSMRLASQAMEPLRSRLDSYATWTAFRPLGL